MPRSRGRKPKAGKPPPPSPPPKAKAWSPKQILLKLFGGLVVAAIFYVLQDAYFGKPTIDAIGAEANSPFLFPFEVRNSGTLFNMRNMRWTCEIEHAEFGVGMIMDNGTLTTGGGITLAAGETGHYGCPIAIPGPVKSLSINLIVAYSTLVFPRHYSESFQWLVGASHPQWVKGKSLR